MTARILDKLREPPSPPLPSRPLRGTRSLWDPRASASGSGPARPHGRVIVVPRGSQATSGFSPGPGPGPAGSTLVSPLIDDAAAKTQRRATPQRTRELALAPAVHLRPSPPRARLHCADLPGAPLAGSHLSPRGNWFTTAAWAARAGCSLACVSVRSNYSAHPN